MKKQKVIFRWDRLICYILIIYLIYVCCNYKLKFTSEFNDEFNEYGTRIELIKR